VIIGGGIIGVSIAYHLAKRGLSEIVLLEKDILGGGSSGKCAGGIRTQFSTEINVRFSMLSLAVFKRFKQELGVDPEFHGSGYLFLVTHKDHWVILQRNKERMDSLGLDVSLLDGQATQREWEFLHTHDLIGASYTKDDGYAGPYEVLQGFARGARRLGAILREGIEVTGIRIQKGCVQAVETETGEQILTPVVINATGPYAARVAAMAGLDLPVRPLRRQLFFTEPFHGLPSSIPLIIDLKHGWYMRREGQGLLLSGPEDSKSSFNEVIDFTGQEWAAARSLYRVPILEGARIAGGWAGLYSLSPDHHAIIGSFPEIKGFICANGFSGHGFQHSPAVGILVSELILDGNAKSLDIDSLRPQRFREGDLIYEPLTAFRD